MLVNIVLFLLVAFACRGQQTSDQHSGAESCRSSDTESIAKVQDILEELTLTRLALKQAVKENNYVAAAEHQAKEAGLTATLTKTRTARAARAAECASGGFPLSATDMEVVAMAAWEEEVNALLLPLESAINTTLAILQHGLSLAAPEGYMVISIRPPSTDALRRLRRERDPHKARLDERRRRNAIEYVGEYEDYEMDDEMDDEMRGYHSGYQKEADPNLPATPEFSTEFVVHLGFCQVPVGQTVTESEVAEYHEAVVFRRGHNAPHHEHACSEEQLQSLAATFDGETLHAFQDLERVLLSVVGQLSLRWRLHEAGFTTRTNFVMPQQSLSMTRNQATLPIMLNQRGSGESGAWLEVGYGRAGRAHAQFSQPDSTQSMLTNSDSFVAYVEAVVKRRSALTEVYVH